MRPYTEVKSPDLPDSVFRYDLFAVVTHEGKLDNGHYWADVLSSGEWWHCDDDKGKSIRVPRIEISKDGLKWKKELMDSDAYYFLCCKGSKGLYALLRQEVFGICQVQQDTRKWYQRSYQWPQ